MRPGLWVPWSIFTPHPPSAQTPLPVPLIRPQEMPSLPDWSFQNPCHTSPTYPERESEHSCFLWSPPGPPRSLDCLVASPGPQGTEVRACRDPGRSRAGPRHWGGPEEPGLSNPLRQ